MSYITGNIPGYHPFLTSKFESSAGQTRDENGEIVGIGKLTLRLEVIKGDDRFNIEILADQPATETNKGISKDDYTQLRFVNLEGKHETVYVSKKDLEQRLHISMEKIADLIPEELGRVIANQVPYVAMAVDLVEETIKRKIFEIEPDLSGPGLPSRVLRKNPSPSKSSEGSIDTGLHADTLMKMAKLTVHGKNILETRNKTYAFKNKKGVIKIYPIHFEDPIESGYFNRIFKITELSKNKPVALKVPILKDPRSIQDHKNLIYILNLLNENPHPAIQKNPKIITVLNTGEICTLFTYRHTDAFKLIRDKTFFTEFTSEEITTNFRNCADALAYMIEMDVYHGDIKEENLLVSLKPNEKRLIFSDFGGSIHDKAEDPQRPTLGIHAPKVTPVEDLQILQKAQKLFDKAVKFEKNYVSNLEKFKGWKKELENELLTKENELHLLSFDIAFSEGRLFKKELAKNKVKQASYAKQLETRKKLEKELDELKAQLKQCESLLSRDPQAERIESKRQFLHLKERLQVFNLAHCFCCLMTGTSPLYSRKFYDFVENERPQRKEGVEYSFKFYHDLIIKKGGTEEFAKLIEDAMDPNPLSEKRLSAQEFNDRIQKISIF